MKGRRIDTLSEEHITEKVQKAYSDFQFNNKKLLIIIPDNTRTAPIDIFFKLFHKAYLKTVRKMDYLIALGTHPLLSEQEKYKRVGINKRQKEQFFTDVHIMNHRWDKKETFIKIGTIDKTEMENLTLGFLHESADIFINKIIYDYDIIIVLGPVFPHEITGFSGSNKYFFPGICGWNFTDITHWLGALQTNLKTIGMRDTPSRRLIDRAAEMVKVSIIYFNLVVDEEGLKGLFIGEDKSAWEKAVDMSSVLNIKYVEKVFKNVMSIPSKKYDDFWTGAKAFYKIETIMKEGGQIIVYAPHIKHISITHNDVIQQIGFHVKDYFVAHMDRYVNFHKTVLAYSALVKGTGTYIKGVEKPRIRIILSSGVSSDTCEKLNIHYKNPDEINISEWENLENEGIKVIYNSGEVLYRVKQ